MDRITGQTGTVINLSERSVFRGQRWGGGGRVHSSLAAAEVLAEHAKLGVAAERFQLDK